LAVVCEAQNAELYASCPFIDEVVAFERTRLISDEAYREAMLEKLRGWGAELILHSVYSRDPIGDLLALGAGDAPKYALTGDASNLDPARLRQHNEQYRATFPSPGDKPELERHRDFLRALELDEGPLEPLVWLTEDDERFAEQWFAKSALVREKTLVLASGTRYAIKLFPKYAEAISRVVAERGLTVVALGSAWEAESNRAILERLQVPTYNLCGELTIRQSAAIIKRCALLVGADSSNAHIACAVGTPHVVVMGGGHFGRFMPYSPLTSLACLPLECFGCNWVCRYQRAHCTQDLSPQVVEAAIRGALERKSDLPRVYLHSANMWKQTPGMPAWRNPGDLFGQVEVETIEVDSANRGTHASASAIFSAKNKARPVATLITPTTGKRELALLVRSVERQTAGPVLHILLWDDVRDPDALRPQDYDGEHRLSLVLPPGMGKNGNAPGSALRAVGLMAASTPWVLFADDDVRWEDDHLERLVAAAAGRGWAATLRRIWSPAGESLGVDRFESVGDDAGRRVPYEMFDGNCMMFKRELGVAAAALYRETREYNDDRLMYSFLRSNAGPPGRTGRVTINHICPPRLVDFFRQNCSPE